jgi:thiol-disulfide isomerase/thioredoxin
MRRSASFADWIRRAIIATTILGVIVISIDALTSLPAEASFMNTQEGDNGLIGELSSILPTVLAARSDPRSLLADDGPMPDFNGGVAWFNSAPVNSRSLRGKVVLVNFWTYTCINSLRALPYVKGWATKYQEAGLVVIGVHTPEFSFEKQQSNVEAALGDLRVTYPVVMDNNYRIWQDFSNQYWPALYIVDAKGRIRYEHFGEGGYGASERVIQELLKENGASDLDLNLLIDIARGIEAPPSDDEGSPESYIGYHLADRFSSPEGLDHDKQRIYSLPTVLRLNHWGLGGSWNVNAESAVPQAPSGRIVFRFHSRDLHLVMAPTKDGKPVRFKVTLDGVVPGADCGTDSTRDGTGEVREPRLYQLIRQKGPVKDRTFEIEFLDPGVQALDFTFG